MQQPLSLADPRGAMASDGFGPRPSASSSSSGASVEDGSLRSAGSGGGGGGGGYFAPTATTAGTAPAAGDKPHRGARGMLGHALGMVLLAAACLAASMLVSSTGQLGGTALVWPATPVAALFISLNPSWMRRWLAAGLLLTYVLMVLLDFGKVRGALFLNVLFLLTDAAEVASVTLCLGVLLASGPPSLIRTGAALNAIMLFPVLLAPLKAGLNCLLIYICFSALRIPLWETLLIWVIGDCFMDFFVVYVVLVVRYYWWSRKDEGLGQGSLPPVGSMALATATAADLDLDLDAGAGGGATAAAAAAAAAAGESDGRVLQETAATAAPQDAMDAAEKGRAVRVNAQAKKPPSPPPGGAGAGAKPAGSGQKRQPLADAWTSSCSRCCMACAPAVVEAVERLLGPVVARWFASPRALPDAILFVFLMASVAVTSFASILNTSRIVEQPLFYLSSRLLFPVIGYVTVYYGQLGACLNVAVAALSMLVTDFVADADQRSYGAISVSSFGALFQVLVCPLLVVTISWSISYLAVALAERQDTLLLLEEKNAQLVAQGRELREAKQSAEAALSSKTEFFARVSHEFRTPLNVVLGFSEELTKCPDLALTPETADRIHYILAAGESLLRVVDDILELFRLSSTSSRGRLRIQLTGVDVRAFFGTVCDLVEAIAQENGQHFIRHLDPALPRFLLLDRVRVSQLVMNLASNACKYSRPAGGVVSIRLINDGPWPGRPGHITLRLDVQDNGPGIPPELKERIFESFFRAGDPTAPGDGAHHDGTGRDGAGPPLSATPRGAGGGGSSSRLSPLAHAPLSRGMGPLLDGGGGGGGGLPPGLAPSSKAKGHGLGLAITKQLVDILEGRIVVQSSLGLGSLFTIYLPARVAEGCSVEGEEGWGAAGGGAAAGGSSAAATTSSSFSFSSGHGNGGAAAPGATAGPGQGPGPGHGGEQQEAPVRELRILSVEDILVNQIVLGGMLQQDGHSVAFVETGGAALAAVYEAAPPFDVVLLDLQLPDMHGIDVLRTLRSHPDPAVTALPVVVVSALALDREKQECALAGADGFITKPVKLSLLRQELRRLWASGRVRPRGAGEAEGAAAAAAAEPDASGGYGVAEEEGGDPPTVVDAADVGVGPKD